MTTVEKECGALEFQLWSQTAASMDGYINKGWALTDDKTKMGMGWVNFETANQAMMFKLSA